MALAPDATPGIVSAREFERRPLMSLPNATLNAAYEAMTPGSAAAGREGAGDAQRLGA